MTFYSGKVCVITGAASGIGRALAYDLAKRGALLALSDVDDVGLAETARQAVRLGAQVRTDRLDVSDRPAVLAYADAVVAHFGVVNVVINNAGIAFTGDIEEMAFSDIEHVMNIDFWGVVNGTKAFLPYLIASGDGHVVNISSLFGLLATPSQGAYNAAKFAVRGFTEALRQEMLVAGHPVRVTCVHPGGVSDRDRPQRRRCPRARRRCAHRLLRPAPRAHVARTGFADDPARGRARPRSRARRPRRPGTRPARPADRFGLPARRRDVGSTAVPQAKVPTEQGE